MTPQIIAVGSVIDGRCTITAVGQDGKPYTFTGTAEECDMIMAALAERDVVSVDELKVRELEVV